MMKKGLHITLILLLTIGYLVFPAPKAEACGICKVQISMQSKAEWQITDTTVKEALANAFKLHQKAFLEQVFWKTSILPGLEGMAEELSSMVIHQARVIGGFFDAKQQLETEQTLQEIKARATKDYQPSEGMCQFGSAAKSLAASEFRAELSALTLSQRAQDRHLGAYGAVSAPGDVADKDARIQQFKEKFCDPADNNGGLYSMCKHGENIGATNPERMNKDIDFVRTVDAPWTIDIDFTNPEVSPAEEEIFALASNLYGHDVIRAAKNALLNKNGKSITDKQEEYMNFRALLAKRSVAENSFNAVVAMKSSGSPASQSYLNAMLQELGIGAEETTKILGNNPSYYAQMEMLTKKLYQNPSFYTNLYDKPANILRKEVALQAVGLMQKFDLFKSHLRNEASMAVLLELAVEKLQDKADNEASSTSPGQGSLKGGS